MQSRNYDFNKQLKVCRESKDFNEIYRALGEINRNFHLNEQCYRERYFEPFLFKGVDQIYIESKVPFGGPKEIYVDTRIPPRERAPVERMLALIRSKRLRRKMSFESKGHYPQYLKEFASEYERYKNGGYMGVFDSYYGLTYPEYQELILDAARSNTNEPDLDKEMTFEHGLVCKILSDEEKGQFEFPRKTYRF